MFKKHVSTKPASPITKEEFKALCDYVENIPNEQVLQTLYTTIANNAGGVQNMDPEMVRAFANSFAKFKTQKTESRKRKTIKLTEGQLRKTIRKVIQEAFWNKYGQPIGSRFRGGQLHQNLGMPYRPKEKYNQMLQLLRGYQRKCNHATLGSEMNMNGVWVKLAMGLLSDISCYDGTKEPVQCKLKFQGERLIFDEVEDLESFLNEPELLKMQKEETEKMNVEYGRY